MTSALAYQEGPGRTSPQGAFGAPRECRAPRGPRLMDELFQTLAIRLHDPRDGFELWPWCFFRSLLRCKGFEMFGSRRTKDFTGCPRLVPQQGDESPGARKLPLSRLSSWTDVAGRGRCTTAGHKG